MLVEFKNYYDVLGVTQDADDAEIKDAFRSLARKYHPDVAKDKNGAKERFEDINEAHEVLSDPDKRRKYDEVRANWKHPDKQTPQKTGEVQGGPEDGSEFHFDGTGFSNFFEHFFGSRHRRCDGFDSTVKNGKGGASFAQRGHDTGGNILVTLGEVLRGSTRTIRMQRTDPLTGQTKMQTLRVKIPPGVRKGQLIRLAGRGQEGIGGGVSGNLYLRVIFAKHPDFRVQGADLYDDLELSPKEAALGATIQVPTIDGRAFLKIPAGTTAGQQFRLRGKGLPTGDGARGDLHAIVYIPRFRRTLRRMKKICGSSSPQNRRLTR